MLQIIDYTIKKVILWDGCFLGFCQKFDTPEHSIEVAMSFHFSVKNER